MSKEATALASDACERVAIRMVEHALLRRGSTGRPALVRCLPLPLAGVPAKARNAAGAHSTSTRRQHRSISPERRLCAALLRSRSLLTRKGRQS